MDDRVETTIGELRNRGTVLIQTGPFGSQLHSSDYEPTGVPVVPTEAIGRRLLRTEALPRVSLATARRLQRHALRRGDILFARRGAQATGLSAIIKPEQEGWLCGTGAILLRVNDATLDPEFLSFALTSERSMTWLKQHAVGAVMPNLNEDVICGLSIPIPTGLSEQRAIAHILGTLDDKIELNRRMNETLEAMARAIFKSWFVDFDPVRAKAAGRQPAGMDADTAALFPDGFEDSALGEIPRGWRLSAIGEEVRVVGGSTPSTGNTSYWEPPAYHWSTPKDLASLTSPVLLDTERKISAAGLDQIGSGLLPAGTVLLSSRAPIGYLAIASIPTAINQGFIAMICDQRLSNYFVLHWARYNMEDIKNRANGTTFLEISKSNFRPIPVLVPTEPVLQAFNSTVYQMYQRLVTNLHESCTLAAIRDALLPKLLSGEIRINEAERLMIGN